jgi:hypothetical protein
VTHAPSPSDQIRELIEAHDLGRPFTVVELELDEALLAKFVRIRRNPQVFRPSLFTGDWADTGSHPVVGPIRVLRVMRGKDRVTRVIGRQGANLYATPWL